MNPINKIALGVGAALALIIVIAFVGLLLTKAHLETQLAQAQTRATACAIANDDFAAAIAQQNKAVVQFKSDSIAREKQAHVADMKARDLLRSAQKLRQIKMHGDVCAAADHLFAVYLTGTP